MESSFTDKVAVLSMDVEDWYHTGYLREAECEKGFSRLDGMDLFLSILGRHGIASELFVLADLLKTYPERFRLLRRQGHVLSSHGASHIPPLQMNPDDFRRELEDCVAIHRQVLDETPRGFRAARFMLDRTRLDLVRHAGFAYDSSAIFRAQHCDFDFNGFTQVSPNILQSGDFFEFRPASASLGGLNWPVAGGGAFRIFPWWLSVLPLRRMASAIELYSFYIHPIDISQNAECPPLPRSTSRIARWRMNYGRLTTASKLEKLIVLLQKQGFRFSTYEKLREQLTSHQSRRLQSAVRPG